MAVFHSGQYYDSANVGPGLCLNPIFESLAFIANPRRTSTEVTQTFLIFRKVLKKQEWSKFAMDAARIVSKFHFRNYGINFLCDLFLFGPFAKKAFSRPFSAWYVSKFPFPFYGI